MSTLTKKQDLEYTNGMFFKDGTAVRLSDQLYEQLFRFDELIQWNTWKQTEQKLDHRQTQICRQRSEFKPVHEVNERLGYDAFTVETPVTDEKVERARKLMHEAKESSALERYKELCSTFQTLLKFVMAEEVLVSDACDLFHERYYPAIGNPLELSYERVTHQLHKAAELGI